ncbi:SMI1/KNR4 family protein [Variovorax sp. CY25R-8]|uniref:SMI1/KNR4 family protein n=1 Tax=Variovorax sp. CY25R-8 TaxID=2855501 RepID=UPI0021BB9C60|nr:SMI1/KNR4 family protein [Variovorax sp. CY25R-8]MCT8175769.1 SMI1/KNR4 family protein [Variovorax sp. CY25R-8]
MSTRLSSNGLAPVLRIAMGLLIVLAMGTAGWLHRSPWIVLLATPLFTVLYALGKWNAWTLAWRLGGAQRIALSALVTLPIQAVLAGVFYLLGLGLSMLLAPTAPIAVFSGADAQWAAALFVLAVAVSAAIIRLEDVAPEPVAATPSPVSPAAETEPELDIDPTALNHDTFFESPGYWRTNAAREALAQRGTPVEKPPFAASEAMIEAAEARLGFRLPDTLRALYGRMNGGYVGWLYVPLKRDAGPFHDDWRGAFSIDYSSLATLAELRTVAEHYEDFTHDPEDVPAGADKLVVLQARYGDMTLLDYTRGPQARVLIADFDRQPGVEPVDIAFESFDHFFAALRRVRPERGVARTVARDLGPPLGEAPEQWRASMFWGEAQSHFFHLNAVQRKDGSEPQLVADDALIAQTEARLGLRLPRALVALWRVKNGGGVSCRWVDIADGEGQPYSEALRYLMPMEYLATLAELSDRIVFPPGETPWKQRFDAPQRLVVLEADHGRVVMLDYRDSAAQAPAVLVVDDLDRGPPRELLRFDSVDALLTRLRPKSIGYEDVAKPWQPPAATA